MIKLLPLIAQRESIRSYDPLRPLPETIINEILEAGRLAPSAANLQPWTFWLISSKEMLEKVHNTYYRAWLIEAPHILIVTGNKKIAWTRADGYNSLETDLTIAMDHMILAAENLGVGTCWVGNFNNALLREILHLSVDEEVFAMTPLGYPKNGFVKTGKKIRKDLHEIVNRV